LPESNFLLWKKLAALLKVIIFVDAHSLLDLGRDVRLLYEKTGGEETMGN